MERASDDPTDDPTDRYPRILGFLSGLAVARLVLVREGQDVLGIPKGRPRDSYRMSQEFLAQHGETHRTG